MASEGSIAELLLQSRTKAGLSQRELATRAGTAQSVVARIEAGQTSPTVGTLERLLTAAGFELRTGATLRPVVDDDVREEVARILALTPEARLSEVANVTRSSPRRSVADLAPLDPQRIVVTLGRHRVRYVLLGDLAGRLQGLPRFSARVEIAPAAEGANLVGVAAALRELDARVFVEGVPTGLTFDCTARTLSRSERWKLSTAAGRLDLDFRPAGTDGYEDLARDAIRFEVFGVELIVASVEGLIRTMEAADRPHDRQNVILMREALQGR